MNQPNSKFIIQCWVGSQLREVSEHQLSFSDNSPGCAKLTIKGTAKPRDIVAVELGWGDSVYRPFTGYIDRVSPNSNGYSTIFCRELSAVLFNQVNIVLRHPTLNQVVSEVTQKTGVRFRVPNSEYANTPIPCFFSTGNGYMLLDGIGKAFSIKNFMWQQQGDGTVFVGSYADSMWSARPVSIPEKILTATESAKKFILPCLPQLKPSCLVNNKQLVSVTHKKTETIIEWI